MKGKISCNRHTLDRLKLQISSVINLHFSAIRVKIYPFCPPLLCNEKISPSLTSFENALLIITQLFIPSGETAGKRNIINLIVELLLNNVGWSFLQNQVHLYFPSSASVTLKMVIMKSVLHFVLVFLS